MSRTDACYFAGRTCADGTTRCTGGCGRRLCARHGPECPDCKAARHTRSVPAATVPVARLRAIVARARALLPHRKSKAP